MAYHSRLNTKRGFIDSLYPILDVSLYIALGPHFTNTNIKSSQEQAGIGIYSLASIGNFSFNFHNEKNIPRLLSYQRIEIFC